MNEKSTFKIDYEEFAITNTRQRFYRVHLVKANQQNDWTLNLIILFRSKYREERTTWSRHEKISSQNHASCSWRVRNKQFDCRNEWSSCYFWNEIIIDAKRATSFAFFVFECSNDNCDNALNNVNWNFRIIRRQKHEIKNHLCFNYSKHSFKYDLTIVRISLAKSWRRFIVIKTFVIIVNRHAWCHWVCMFYWRFTYDFESNRKKWKRSVSKSRLLHKRIKNSRESRFDDMWEYLQ